MSERLKAGEITEAQLTELYDKLAQAGRTVAGLQAANQRLNDRREKAEVEAAEAVARIAACRAAVHIADADDVTDWQRGYRACSDRVIAALDRQTSCDHPVTEVVANLPRLDLFCQSCGTVLAEHTGDDYVPDQSWLFPCPVPFCRAPRLSPCVRKSGIRAAISHGDRWARYDRALKVALRAVAAGGTS